MNTEGSAARAPLRVLVLEDDPRLLATYRRCLGLPEYEVIACATVAAAQAVLRDLGADIAIVDLQLGARRLAGLTFIEDLARRQPTLPCLVVTGHDDPETQRRLEAAALPVLLKPFSVAQLMTAVAGILAATRRARGPQPAGPAA